LQDIANQRFERRFNLRTRNPCCGFLFEDFTVGIASIGSRAQANTGAIAFISIEQKLGKLGRLTKTQGQNTGSKRVERTGMTGFLYEKQTLGALQSMVGSHACRFVQQQYAIDWTAFSTCHE
jgi:hypothetical protein